MCIHNKSELPQWEQKRSLHTLPLYVLEAKELHSEDTWEKRKMRNYYKEDWQWVQKKTL